MPSPASFEPIIVYASMVKQLFNSFVSTRNPSLYPLISALTSQLPTILSDRASIAAEIKKSPNSLLPSLILIYSHLTFLNWKMSPDFEDTGVSIAEKVGATIRDIIYESNYFKGTEGKNKHNVRVSYVPNVNPFVVTGNANQQSSLDFINEIFEGMKSSVEASIVEFSVEVLKAKINHVDTKYFNHPRFRIREHVTFEEMRSVLIRFDPDIIVLDYFTLPNIFIPFWFPNARVIYLSFGFSAVDLPFVSAVITAPSRNSKLVNYFKTSPVHPRIVNLKRPKSLNINLMRRWVSQEPDLQRLEEFRAKFPFIICSLCRAEKVSAHFLNLCNKILQKNTQVGVLIAGPNVPMIHQYRPFESPDRYCLLQSSPPYEILSRSDVYLETFPEHQGYAVIEAYMYGIPTITLSSRDYYHQLLHERAETSVRQSPQELIGLILELINNNEGLRREMIIGQQKKLSELCSSNGEWFSQIERLVGIE